MRVAIVAPSPIPFVVGGAEKLWWGMQRHINENTTHSCELLKVPVKEHTVVDLLQAYYQFFTLDLSSYDRVISTKYPAFMVQHPDHHLYLQHLLRGCYDTYSAQLSTMPPWANPQLQRLLRTISRHDINLTDTFSELFSFIQQYPHDPQFNQFPGPMIRSILHTLDRRGMEGVKQFSAISHTVKKRVEYFPPTAQVTVIHHPSNLNTLTNNEQQYLFTASRLDSPKRIDLLIEGYKKSHSKLPFFIAGTGPQQNKLKQLASGDNRIKFLGFVSDKDLEKHYSNAAAVLYAPYDEDYGLITIEALSCGKPVVTCSDSGGVTEFIQHGINGFVAQPNVASLAAAIDDIPQLLHSETVANCRASVKDISWQRLIDHLVDDKPSVSDDPSQRALQRKQVVVVSTYPVYSADSGGQLRLFHLLKRLASRHTITLLSLGGKHHQQKKITPYFTEYILPQTEEFIQHKKTIEKQLGISASDIAFMCHDQSIPEFSEQFAQHAQHADIVVCAQPYVYPLVQRHYQGDIIHESQNVEYLLKSSMVKSHHEQLLQTLFETEKQLCQRATLTIACADEDIAKFQQLYQLDSAKYYLLPNGVDIDSTPFLTPTERQHYKHTLGIEQKIALFVGSGHQPNVDAVNVILDLARQLPEVYFVIVGSVSHYFTAEDEPRANNDFVIPKNVAFTGVVSHEQKSIYLQIADIALNPIQTGSGSNLKLAEYIAAGIPVITTQVGARGYQAELIAQIDVAEIGCFKQHVMERLVDPLPARLQKARETIAANYHWDVIARGYPF